MIPERMRPNTNHPSILSILQCENDTVLNVLVDQVIVIIAYTAVNILIQGFFYCFIEIYTWAFEITCSFIFLFFLHSLPYAALGLVGYLLLVFLLISFS